MDLDWFKLGNERVSLSNWRQNKSLNKKPATLISLTKEKCSHSGEGKKCNFNVRRKFSVSILRNPTRFEAERLV